jgi:hypothetical protein
MLSEEAFLKSYLKLENFRKLPLKTKLLWIICYPYIFFMCSLLLGGYYVGRVIDLIKR